MLNTMFLYVFHPFPKPSPAPRPLVRLGSPWFRHCAARLRGAAAAHRGRAGAGLHQNDEPHLGRLRAFGNKKGWLTT